VLALAEDLARQRLVVCNDSGTVADRHTESLSNPRR
jgi:hypothetical protein